MLIIAIFLGYLGIYSCWDYWSGGWSWGPRFLLPALPAVAALLGLLQGKWMRILATFVLIRFLVNAPTLVSFFERYYAEALQQGMAVST